MDIDNSYDIQMQQRGFLYEENIFPLNLIR